MHRNPALARLHTRSMNVWPAASTILLTIVCWSQCIYNGLDYMLVANLVKIDRNIYMHFVKTGFR